MKPIDVKVDTYIDFDVEKNDKYSEFKAGDHVWISKYKNIFAKRYTHIGGKTFWSKMLGTLYCGCMLLKISRVKATFTLGTFYEKELQKNNQSLESKRYWEEKAIDYVSNGRDMIIHSTPGFKNIYIRMSQKFSDFQNVQNFNWIHVLVGMPEYK